jgi:GTPase SAR1 family protein
VYYDIADCIVIVYDVTQKESFDSVDTWLNSVTTLTNKQPETLLIGNKIDIPKKRMIAKKLGLQYAYNKGAHFQETSAVNASATTDLLENITNYVLGKRREIPSPAIKPIAMVETGCLSCSVI